jgi:hypothetical protein
MNPLLRRLLRLLEWGVKKVVAGVVQAVQRHADATPRSKPLDAGTRVRPIRDQAPRGRP